MDNYNFNKMFDLAGLLSGDLFLLVNTLFNFLSRSELFDLIRYRTGDGRYIIFRQNRSGYYHYNLKVSNKPIL